MTGPYEHRLGPTEGPAYTITTVITTDPWWNAPRYDPVLPTDEQIIDALRYRLTAYEHLLRCRPQCDLCRHVGHWEADCPHQPRSPHARP